MFLSRFPRRLSHTVLRGSLAALLLTAPAWSHALEAGAPASANASAPDCFEKKNLTAWCIVPYDGAKRSPEERAAMLEKIGVRKFVYDYRREHVPQWDTELEALRRHGIELTGWWFPAALNEEAKQTLELFKRHGVKPQIWVSGGGGSLQASTPEEQEIRINKEIARIRPIAEAAAAQGLKVGLYNHGGWFGEPENQITVIERLKTAGIQNVGIVYNQHHGHSHLERFPQLLQAMLPHLICLNLNGMDIAGDTRGRKILPIGAGSEDVSLLGIIRKSGYSGPIGILNHTGADAEARLLDNLDGLQWVCAQLNGSPAGPKPAYRTFKATP